MRLLAKDLLCVLILALLVLQGGARAMTLCVQDDGAIAIEFGKGACCTAPAEAPKHTAWYELPVSCARCTDIPLPLGGLMEKAAPLPSRPAPVSTAAFLSDAPLLRCAAPSAGQCLTCSLVWPPPTLLAKTVVIRI